MGRIIGTLAVAAAQAQEARLPGEPPGGASRPALHPIEPGTVRAYLSWNL
jgi:hypothetical protein